MSELVFLFSADADIQAGYEFCGEREERHIVIADVMNLRQNPKTIAKRLQG